MRAHLACLIDWREGRARAFAVAFALAVAFSAVVAKAAVLSLGAMPSRDGVAAVFDETGRRADILDRNGELLATSVEVYSLFADPRAIWDAEDTARQLVDIFPDLDLASLSTRLANRERAFVWVRREITPRQRQRVFELGLEGIGFRRESRRVYPRGNLAGHVLGFTGIDGEGLSGVEFALDHRLREGGAPLGLTLDSGVQFALEAELDATATRLRAEGGAGLVMNVANGEVLALASWPPVNPNRARTLPNDDPARLNRASGAVYELGSVFKPLTVAAALEHGKLRPSEQFDVNEPIRIAGAEIRDLHLIDSPASVADIIADSSNIGTVRIVQRLGAEEWRAALAGFGLFDRAPLELAGSAAPILPERWDALSLATTSYGHGLAVSPAAYLAALSAIANDGVWVAPRLVPARAGGEAGPAPRRVVSPETAGMVKDMMRETVTRGTGTRADAPGYRVAGKTGTAEKPIPGGYSETDNVVSFAAFFPAERPEYALLIMLDTPRPEEADGVMRGTTAAWTAAPVAGRVIERIAPLLGVAPRFEAAASGEAPARSAEAGRSGL